MSTVKYVVVLRRRDGDKDAVECATAQEAQDVFEESCYQPTYVGATVYRTEEVISTTPRS